LAIVPLSDDQKALLRLLARREEGYDDIAALMGLSVDEVRRRVKEAVAGLDEGKESEGGGAAVPVLGQGSSSSQAAGEEPSPTPPAEKTPAPSEPPPTRRPIQSEPRPRASLSWSRRRLWEMAGGALVLLLLVLFATGAIDIGGDSDSDSSPGESADTPSLEANSDKITQAALEPVDGGDASGRALFGRLGKQVVLQVIADGLEPTAPGETYTVWLYRSPKLSLRVGAVRVGEAGQLGGRFAIPPEVLALVANGAFGQIDVSRTSDSAYRAEVAQAKKEQRLPRYTGESILRGDIVGPLAEAEAAGN
jgi:hypothetical protein